MLPFNLHNVCTSNEELGIKVIQRLAPNFSKSNRRLIDNTNEFAHPKKAPKLDIISHCGDQILLAYHP